MKRTHAFLLLNCLGLLAACSLPEVNEEIPEIGGPDAACFTFTLLNSPCTQNCEVEFDASCSSGAEDYAWDFGDGNMGSGQSTTHTYDGPGTYDVTLEVSAQGMSDDTTFAVTVPAQVTTFELFSTIGSQGGETAYDHIIDLDGNYVVCGRSENLFAESRPFACKVLRSGALNWQETYSPDNFPDETSPLQSVFDNSGQDYFFFSSGNGISAPAFRADRAGNFINGSEAGFPAARVLDPKPRVNLIAFHSNLFATCFPTICPDQIILSDLSGNNQTPSGINNFDRPVHQLADVEIDAQNNILVSGYSFERMDGSGASLDSTVATFALLGEETDFGNILANTLFNLPGASKERVIDSAIDEDGNIYHLLYIPDDANSIGLIKMDPGGAYLFPEVMIGYGQNGFTSDIPVSLDVTRDGHLIIAGHTNSFSAGFYRIFLLKLDTDGNTVWNPEFKLYGDNMKTSVAAKVTVDPLDGGFIVSGTRGVESFNMDFPSQNVGDLYVFKTDPEGEF